MKTINNLDASNITDKPDIRDAAFAPRASFARTLIQQADGFHAFYQLGDGKTTGHLFISISDIMGLFEKADANFTIPVKTS